MQFEHNLEAIAFPRFDELMLAGLSCCPRTKLKRYRDGERLFTAGDRDFKFFIVKSGEIEIVDESGDEPKTVTVHGPGHFTGEVAQISGGTAIVSGIARGDIEVYEVTNDALREIVNDHPDLGDVILQAFIARRQLLRASGGFTGLRVIGSRFSADCFRVRDFLTKNRAPFTWLDLEDDPLVARMLEPFGLSAADTPVVAWGRSLLLRNPSNRELAEALGLRRLPSHQSPSIHDLVVVGAGPAGLAAAVYGASEGLNTIVLERAGPGGQAGRSMRIENYLGFPTGITGADLAERATMQANKFGASLPVGTQVTGLSFDAGCPVIELDGGETIRSRCLLIATGAEYRMLGIPGCDQFEGRGIYYAATPLEAQMCRGSDVLVVGGGNSAGQAAVFLSSQVGKVYLAVRGDSLYVKMSSYLARRIEDTPRIEVLLNTEVRRVSGEGALNEVELVNRKTGEGWTIRVPALFSFTGAVPRTDWLPPEIERDEKQFVRTGPGLAQSTRWTARRPPFFLETSQPGVFAAGDVRSGSVKRVASAVGEGSMAVQLVHEYLREAALTSASITTPVSGPVST